MDEWISRGHLSRVSSRTDQPTFPSPGRLVGAQTTARLCQTKRTGCAVLAESEPNNLCGGLNFQVSRFPIFYLPAAAAASAFAWAPLEKRVRNAECGMRIWQITRSITPLAGRRKSGAESHGSAWLGGLLEVVRGGQPVHPTSLSPCQRKVLAGKLWTWHVRQPKGAGKRLERRKTLPRRTLVLCHPLPIESRGWV